jgi:hypothetical protein
MSEDALSRIFPVLSVLAVYMAAGAFKVQAWRLRDLDPKKGAASAALARGLGLWAPWMFLPLAVGAVLGKATIDDAFRPQATPWGLAQAISDLVVYVRLAVWLYGQRGGEFISEHWNLIDRRWPAPSPAIATLLASLMILAGVAAVVGSWLAGG